MHNLKPAYQALGTNVREFRKSRGLSQVALGEMTGLHRSYIADVERGARNASVGTLIRLALPLRVTVSELCQGVEKAVTLENGIG